MGPDQAPALYHEDDFTYRVTSPCESFGPDPKAYLPPPPCPGGIGLPLWRRTEWTLPPPPCPGGIGLPLWRRTESLTDAVLTGRATGSSIVSARTAKLDTAIIFFIVGDPPGRDIDTSKAGKRANAGKKVQESEQVSLWNP
jgi:hypothetical protein